MRKSTSYCMMVGLGGLLLAFLMLVCPFWDSKDQGEAEQRRARVVRELQLTDLCLFTEARYTRHLSQADLFSPFQDHPMAFEHFPSGSLVLPPEHLFKSGISAQGDRSKADAMDHENREK